MTADVLSGAARWHIEQGDALDVLRALPDASVDAVVTDPPAGIGFMGRAWDGDRGGRLAWCAWLAEILREARRALKPGGHALVWALPRTSHWTGCAVEDAGFEVRDCIVHHFGSGFPKSLDVGDGRGTALKPASEHWWLARTPLVGTVAANVAAHGTGAINVDGCRVGAGAVVTRHTRRPSGSAVVGMGAIGTGETSEHVGRFPPNLLLSHADGCVRAGEREVRTSQLLTTHRLAESENAAMSGKNYARAPSRDWGTEGRETVPAYECAPGCPVAELDRQSGERAGFRGFRPGLRRATDGGFSGGMPDPTHKGFADTGGASRFFPTFEAEPPFRYIAKASRREREAGLGAHNHHPTVKPVALMRWLARLVTPPGGVILDPFTGSGTTGVACAREGFRFIGVEREPEYVEIARARIAAAFEPAQPALAGVA